MMTGRRVVVDLGTSHIKVLELEYHDGKQEIVSSQVIDLSGEGLIGAEEINLHLQSLLREIGDYPVILVIPEHLSISKVIRTPRSRPEAIDLEITEETAHLSGLGESVIAYDYYRIPSDQEHADAYWVTIAREADIEEQTARLGTTEVNLAGVTTPSNALAATWLSDRPDRDRIVLVDLGATATVVAIIDEGRHAFASSFPIGGEFFTRAAETTLRIPFDEAETIKRTRDLFADPQTSAPMATAVRTWLAELERTLLEHFQKPEIVRSEFPPLWVRLSGGTVHQPGFLSFLRSESPMEIETWPRDRETAGANDRSRHAITQGAHLHCANFSQRNAGLLPPDIRNLRGRQQRLLRLNFACLAAMLVMLSLLVYGVVQKLEIILEKNIQIEATDSATGQAEAINEMLTSRRADYASVFPLIRSQRKTANVLETFNTLRETRGDRGLWWALLADFKSYTNSTTLDVTNEAPIGPQPLRRTTVQTNVVARTQPPLMSLIAELTIPGEEQTSLQLLSAIVEELKNRPTFERVDRLSTDQKINLLASKYVLTGMTYSVRIDIKDDLTPPNPPVIANTNGPASEILGLSPAESRRPASPVFASPRPTDN